MKWSFLAGLLTSAAVLAPTVVSAKASKLPGLERASGELSSAALISNSLFQTKLPSSSLGVLVQEDAQQQATSSEFAQLKGTMETLGLGRREVGKAQKTDALQLSRGLGMHGGEGGSLPSSSVSVKTKDDGVTMRPGTSAVQKADVARSADTNGERGPSLASRSSKTEGPAFIHPEQLQTTVGHPQDQGQVLESSPRSNPRPNVGQEGRQTQPESAQNVVSAGAPEREAVTASAPSLGGGAGDSSSLLAENAALSLALAKSKAEKARETSQSMVPPAPPPPPFSQVQSRGRQQFEAITPSALKKAKKKLKAVRPVGEGSTPPVVAAATASSDATATVSSSERASAAAVVSSDQGSDNAAPPPPDAPDAPDAPVVPDALTVDSSSETHAAAHGGEERAQISADAVQEQINRMRNRNVPQGGPTVDTGIDYVVRLPEHFKSRFSERGWNSFIKSKNMADRALIRKIALLSPDQWIKFNKTIQGVPQLEILSKVLHNDYLRTVDVQEIAVVSQGSGTQEDARLQTLASQDAEAADIIRLLPLARQKDFLDGPAKLTALRALSGTKKTALKTVMEKQPDLLLRPNILLSEESLSAADSRDAAARRARATAPTGSTPRRDPVVIKSKPQVPLPEQIAALRTDLESLTASITRLKSVPAESQDAAQIRALTASADAITSQIGEKQRYLRENIAHQRRKRAQQASGMTAQSETTAGPVVASTGTTAPLSQEQRMANLRVSLGHAASILDLLPPADQGKVANLKVVNTTGTARIPLTHDHSMVELLRSLSSQQVERLKVELARYEDDPRQHTRLFVLKSAQLFKNSGYVFPEERASTRQRALQTTPNNPDLQRDQPGGRRRNVNGSANDADDEA